MCGDLTNIRMLEPTVLTLPLPPSTNKLFPGRARRHHSPEYEAWIVDAGWELKRQRPRPVLGRVSLTIEVREPPTKRVEDLSNRLKALEDLLVTHGIIQGDSQRYVRRIVLEWAPIDGVRITVEPYSS
jgi:Holliday junction resolvase RusA-like endonuclease